MPTLRTLTENADRFVVRPGDDLILQLLGGADNLVVQGGTVVAYLGLGNDFTRVDAGAAQLYGEAGADRFDIYGVGTRINGGSDNDLFNIRGGSNHLFDGSTGDDRFNFLVGATGERLFGGDGNDLFVGYSNSISGQLYGGAGNDRFLDFGNYGGRTVTLYGGAGNDLYRIAAGAPPAIIELTGEGSDTVQLGAGATYTLPGNVENLITIGSGSGASALTGNGLANRIVGGAGGDLIKGLAGSDRLEGGAGNDTIHGGDGNDRITGGAGLDTLHGGAGSDTFVYLKVGDSPFVNWSADADGIADWTAADRIDLSRIDADPGLAGHQSLHFAGAAFGFPAGAQDPGSVIIGGFGGSLFVSVYIDGGTEPDMIIHLWSDLGEWALTEASLIL